MKRTKMLAVLLGVLLRGVNTDSGLAYSRVVSVAFLTYVTDARCTMMEFASLTKVNY